MRKVTAAAAAVALVSTLVPALAQDTINSLAEERSKTESTDSRSRNSCRRATRVRPPMGGRGRREWCVRSHQRASHPQPDRFV
jgi:hypothetical protein